MGSPLDALLPGNRIVSVNGVRPAQGRDRLDILSIGASIEDDPSRQRTVVTLPGFAGGPTPWERFTPTFSASGGGFSLGNGAVDGALRQESGDTLEASVILTVGSTTNFGSGILLLATFQVGGIDTRIDTTKLPGDFSIGFWSGYCNDLDAATNNRHCRVDFQDESHFMFHPDGVSGFVAGAVPFTWAAGDELRFGVKFPFVFHEV